MSKINTNMAAVTALYHLGKKEGAQNQSIERISSGLRLNHALDDAAGASIVGRMTSQIKGLETGVRNANDAISMISVADGALIEVGNMLQRMRELALQASNGTTASADRDYLNMEYENLITEIERIAQNTQWNGKTILTGDADTTDDATVAFQVGANGGQTIAVDFGDISQSGAATFAQFNLSAHAGSESHISGATATAAQTHITGVLTYVDAAITAVNSQRATYGAAMNQLTYAVDNLSNVMVNSEAARSRIADTDYAQETSELARTQIIQQAGTAMLAQANQLPQTVLSLLQ